MELAKVVNFKQKEGILNDVTIIGVGSIGSILAEEIVKSKIVKNNIILIDHDFVDEKNIGKSAYDDNQIGMIKVCALKEKLKIYEDCPTIQTEFLKFTNQKGIIEEGSFCIDCRDEHYTYGKQEFIHKLFLRNNDALIVDNRPCNEKYKIKTKGIYGSIINSDDIRKLIREYLNKLISNEIKTHPDDFIYTFQLKEDKIQFYKDEVDSWSKSLLNSSKYKSMIDDSAMSTNIIKFLNESNDDSKIIICGNDSIKYHSILPCRDMSKDLVNEIDYMIELFYELFEDHIITSRINEGNLIIFPEYISS